MSTPAQGHVTVIQVRLDELFRAIREQDWGAAQWNFDRVRSAVNKLEASLDEPNQPKGETT
jgi:hypothetical protein